MVHPFCFDGLPMMVSLLATSFLMSVLAGLRCGVQYGILGAAQIGFVNDGP